MNKLALLLPLVVWATGLFAAPAATTTIQQEFPYLAASPFPRQHVDARNSDFVPGVWAPTRYREAWHVLEDRAYTQPCANGPEGNIYCASFHDPGEKCNFTALDSQTGEILWDDRIEGQCLLDEAAAVSVPLVDMDGHVYIPDSTKIVSFTADGRLRWINTTPAKLKAKPETGRSNAPFGLNVLPTGELVTMTLGDGFILVIDRDSGELLAEPLDLPAMKVKAGDTPPRPEGLLENLGSPRGADIVWEFSMGESDNETDNDVSVDTHTATIFITSAAPAPNPKQDGALWAVRYDRQRQQLAVAFYVRFAGPGGSATTPAISKDGQFAVIANNDAQLVVVDIPACLKLAAASECQAFVNYDLGFDLAASPAITPDNRIIASAGDKGVVAIDVSRQADGSFSLNKAWQWQPPGLDFFERDDKGFIFLKANMVTSVITVYENVAVFALSTLNIRGIDWQGINFIAPVTGDATTALVAIDIEHGEEVFHYPDAGELHTASIAADGSTMITVEFNFVSQLFGDRNTPAGVRGWVPVANP